MKRNRLVWVLAILLLVCAHTLHANQKKPLTEGDLLSLLNGGVFSSRLAALVEDHGITFDPTPAVLDRLRKAGAQKSLEHAILNAPRIPLNESKNSRASLAVPVPDPSRSGVLASHGISTRNNVEVDTIRRHPSRALSTRMPVHVLEKSEGSIPVGTKINMGNWVKYQQNMPWGMVELFKGQHFWKMPSDIEIVVGPTVIDNVPTTFAMATKINSGTVRIVHLPNGHNDIDNYRGGTPFPDPQEPDKGYKLLANLWFAYVPHIIAGTSENPLRTCSQTRNRFINCIEFSYVFRQVAYNTDPGVPTDETDGGDAWYTQWLSVEEPEQMKYTTILTTYPKDNQRPKQLYTYLPALRRWIRGSQASHCRAVPGTDYAQDDYKREGFNGGIGMFGAQFIGHQKILALTGDYAPLGGSFPDNYYMPLGWPKPSWGLWQLRDVDVIDIRPVSSIEGSYCYGKRVIYEDSSTHYALWEDAYDTTMHLWKTALLAQRTVKTPALGVIPGGFNSSAWDLENDHMTNTSTQSRKGRDVSVDDEVPKEYQNYVSYSTPAGMAGILK
jgi:hypothetical protein